MNQQQKKFVIVAGVVVGLLFIGGLILSIVGGGSVTVSIVAIPNDSKLTLDGKTIKAGKVSMKKGEHTLTASRTLFTTATKKFNTNNIDTSQPLYILPVPDSASAKDYLMNNPNVQQQREAASGAEGSQLQEQAARKYPILSKLPYTTLDYQIDYSLDDVGNFALMITVYPTNVQSEDPTGYDAEVQQYKQEALQFLKTNNVDTSSVKITYSVSQ